jgi:hypothetical protein
MCTHPLFLVLERADQPPDDGAGGNADAPEGVGCGISMSLMAVLKLFQKAWDSVLGIGSGASQGSDGKVLDPFTSLLEGSDEIRYRRPTDVPQRMGGSPEVCYRLFRGFSERFEITWIRRPGETQGGFE